jgi:23S rRNA (uracil1939-C5)-methyltransferase
VRLAELDEIEVRIEQLVTGGDGLARFEGIPIFVPMSVPGDHLKVRLVKRKPHFGRAEIVEILAPGEGRREAPCAHFADCGGCDLQHIEDSMQSTLKAEATRETLRRLGGIELPGEDRVVSGEAWGYRLRTQVHAQVDENGVRVGYRKRKSHELVPVESCGVCAPELEQAILDLPEHLVPSSPSRIHLALGDEGAVTVAPVIEGLPHGEVQMTIGDFEYAYDARCFFQGNRHLVGELVNEVVGEWTGAKAFDLYGGVGLFSLPLARRYESVLLVEGDAVAARYARINARRNKVADRIEIEHRAVESWLDRLPAGADRVVVDPPRTGLSYRARRQLLVGHPRRITYVSCNPGILARDLKELTELYVVEDLVQFDIFPQTSQMEAVVQLVLRDAPST